MSRSRNVVIITATFLAVFGFTANIENETNVPNAVEVDTPTLEVPPPGIWTEYNKTQYETAKARGYVIVIDFGATWCKYCKMNKKYTQDPKLLEIARENNVILFVADIDKKDNRDLFTEFRVRSLPTYIALFPNGDEKVYVGKIYTIKSALKQLGLL